MRRTRKLCSCEVLGGECTNQTMSNQSGKSGYSKRRTARSQGTTLPWGKAHWRRSRSHCLKPEEDKDGAVNQSQIFCKILVMCRWPVTKLSKSTHEEVFEPTTRFTGDLYCIHQGPLYCNISRFCPVDGQQKTRSCRIFVSVANILRPAQKKMLTRSQIRLVEGIDAIATNYKKKHSEGSVCLVPKSWVMSLAVQEKRNQRNTDCA